MQDNFINILNERMVLIVKKAIINAVPEDKVNHSTSLAVECGIISAEARMRRYTGEGTTINADQRSFCEQARDYEKEFISKLSKNDVTQYAQEVLGENVITKAAIASVILELRQANNQQNAPSAVDVNKAVQKGTVTSILRDRDI